MRCRKRKMIKFGPSGTCADFSAAGHAHTIEVPAWLKEHDLDCFEYSFGRGVRIGESSARAIGAEFAASGAEISVHAPYFINLATLEEEKAENNHRYIFDSLAALSLFGGRRCVIHPGSPLKAERGQAMDLLMKRLEKVAELKHELGYDDMYLCLETMGKAAQLGSLEEVIRMCGVDDSFIPCIDFGHLNAREGGIFFTDNDYARVIERLAEGVGEKKCSIMHVHFSKIEFSAKGEVRHLTFDDEKYGPPYEPLMRVFKKFALSPYIVCESAGTQTRDAQAMKRYYYGLDA